MQLSKRLTAVAEMISHGSSIADVGTDHGYIPIYLMLTGRIKNAIAMDINKGPLERAENNIREHHLEDRIQVRLSDGTASLRTGEAEAVIIAGMGGGLVQKILKEGQEVLESVQEFVLQPQSEVMEVRRFLAQHGYCIIDENMILEDGKYYPVMKVNHGNMDYENPIEYKYGKFLLERKNKVLFNYLQKELDSFHKVRKQLLSLESKEKHIEERQCEINKEIEDIKEALSLYQ
jgi:tRNA (adenine22-N1)-methyltransferase